MLKHGHAVLFVGVLLLSSGLAEAQDNCSFLQVLRRDFIRNDSWPEPFVQYDRGVVSMTVDAMVAKGWERQNLMGAGFFNDDNRTLNRAGEEQVRYILTNLSPQHRTIFVERDLADAVTDARIRAVQRAAAAMLPKGQYAEIAESNMRFVGSPADRIDIVNRKSFASIPDPKLPAVKDDSGGGGGGGGGN